MESTGAGVHHDPESRDTLRASLKKRDYVFGIGLLLIVVFLWTSSNFITQDLFETGFDKPFLVTYLNTSAFAAYLLPLLYRRLYGSLQDHRKSQSNVGYRALATDPSQGEVSQVPPSSIPTNAAPETGSLQPLTTQETAQLAYIFCFFWFIANWSVNAALEYTSVASATILSSMSGFFTLGIGRIFNIEKLTIAKIVAVIMSFIGVILVSLSDSSESKTSDLTGRAMSTRTLSISQPTRPLLGDALALLSAIFYALYVILLKVRIKSESRIDMQLFFGFVGLLNIIGLWPVAILLHYTGLETFSIPHGSKVVMAILINMFITWSSDYLYVLAMLKTTPLVVTVGLSLTIPLAVIGDFFLKKSTKGQVILGALLVVIGFVTIGVGTPGQDDEEEMPGLTASRHSQSLAPEEVELLSDTQRG